MEKGYDLLVRVERIRGRCPVYKAGDRMFFRRGYQLDLRRSDALCSHALGSILPFLGCLSRGIGPASLGLGRDDEVAYLQCPDPGDPYTDGGTVTFGVYRIRQVRTGLGVRSNCRASRLDRRNAS